MFRRSKTEPFVDPELGELVWSRRAWRGQVVLRPDPDALALARTLQAELDRCGASIRAALDDHRAPYVENGGDGDDHPSTPSHAAVVELDDELTIELGYQVSWDEEHTLGARLRNGRLIELNGSVLEP